jgi:hypothetical protein
MARPALKGCPPYIFSDTQFLASKATLRPEQFPKAPGSANLLFQAGPNIVWLLIVKIA